MTNTLVQETAIPNSATCYIDAHFTGEHACIKRVEFTLFPTLEPYVPWRFSDRNGDIYENIQVAFANASPEAHYIEVIFNMGKPEWTFFNDKPILLTNLDPFQDIPTEHIECTDSQVKLRVYCKHDINNTQLIDFVFQGCIKILSPDPVIVIIRKPE